MIFKNHLQQFARKSGFLSSIIIFSLSGQAFAQSASLTSNQALGRSIFKELIEINTTHSIGNTTIAAEAMAKRMIAAGYDEKDVLIVGPEERNRNLIVRLHGTGKQKPILFLSHLDVVEARRTDWTYDPFQLTEKDGYFYGRGTSDIKDGSAILVAEFIRLKQEGFIPDRDLIMALTSGEESRDVYNGAEWLTLNKRDLLDAEFCINMDAGDPQSKDGKRINRTVQISEKGVLNLKIEVKNAGGHGSKPTKDNAIYHLAGGLTRWEAYEFPIQLNPIVQTYFRDMASFESGLTATDMKSAGTNDPDAGSIKRLAAIPYYNALMRNTCVATQLEAGHAINALPQTAVARFNCRILPGNKQADVIREMNRVLADSQIHISIMDSLITNPAFSPDPAVLKIVQQVTEKIWPGLPVIPVMDVGASDGIYLRAAGIPTYGISGVFIDVDDDRAHGKDERIRVKDFYDGLDYEYFLIKAFSSGR